MIEGPAQRVFFEPSGSQVFGRFFRSAAVLLTQGDYFLFALCLIAPARRRRLMWTAFTVFISAELLTIGVSGALRTQFSAANLLIIDAAAASAVVIAAIQDLTNPQSRWLPPLALAFGITAGLSLGDRFATAASFAGSHLFGGLVAWCLAIAIGQSWLFALLSSAAELLRRRAVAIRWAVLAVAVFAGHVALHRLVDRSQLLSELGTMTLERFLTIVVLLWSSVVMCAGVLEAALAGGARTLMRQALTHVERA
jgi:hypothetical protein